MAEVFRQLFMVEKMQMKKFLSQKKLLKVDNRKRKFLIKYNNSISVNGKDQNVLPREVIYDVLTDEPIHVDFLRVVSGVKIRIEVPVEFINHEKSPGLKKRWSS
jgi:large subunit ribosomal protein L25